MDNQNSREWLWKTLGRIDTYIISTNPKTAILIAFNSFIVSATFLSWDKISSLFKTHPSCLNIAEVLACLVIATAMVSLFYALKAVAPYLKSPKAPNTYHSLLFFEHIAEHENGKDFQKSVQALNDSGMETELTSQIHALSKGATKKFSDLTKSMQAILFFEIPALTAIFLLKIIIVLMEIFNRLNGGTGV